MICIFSASVQHLDLTYLVLTFPCILSHNYHFSLIMGRQDNRTRGKSCRSHERALLPNLPTPETLFLPHLLLIPRQGKHHASPRRPPHTLTRYRWTDLSPPTIPRCNRCPCRCCCCCCRLTTVASPLAPPLPHRLIIHFRHI